MTSYDENLACYDAPPADGTNRFLICFNAYAETLPSEAPFFFWETGYGLDYRMRPSLVGTPEAQNLPAEISMTFDTKTYAVKYPASIDDATIDKLFMRIDNFYITNDRFVALVDAEDENKAWRLILKEFPGATENFIKPANETTLTILDDQCGRFEYPLRPTPNSDDAPAP